MKTIRDFCIVIGFGTGFASHPLLRCRVFRGCSIISWLAQCRDGGLSALRESVAYLQMPSLWPFHGVSWLVVLSTVQALFINRHEAKNFHSKTMPILIVRIRKHLNLIAAQHGKWLRKILALFQWCCQCACAQTRTSPTSIVKPFSLRRNWIIQARPWHRRRPALLDGFREFPCAVCS